MQSSGSCLLWDANGPFRDHSPGCPAAIPRSSRLDASPRSRSLLGLPLTYADGGARTFGYLAGAGGLSVVLVYLAVNIAAIRAFRTEFRDEFRLGRHLLIPATATVLFLFPLWGIFHPHAHSLAALLPFTALGWLGIGAITAGILRTRRPTSFETLGRVFTPAKD